MIETKLGVVDQVKVLTHSVQNAFSPNGCSRVPDLNFGTACCNQHDIDYYEGVISRAEADKKLRECIRSKGYLVLPWIYWLGVRLFGRPHYNKGNK